MFKTGHLAVYKFKSAKKRKKKLSLDMLHLKKKERNIWDIFGHNFIDILG